MCNMISFSTYPTKNRKKGKKGINQNINNIYTVSGL